MTTSTLRPNATVTAGSGVTYTGGANWTAVVADDSDATYATLPAGSIATLGLGTVSLPTGAVTKSLVVRFRLRSVTGSTAPSMFAMSSGSQVAWVQTTATTTITTYTGSSAAVNLTQAQVDALQLKVQSNTLGDVRFVELYADLTYATVPTVTLLTPTGTITTSEATATWTYTQGSDGGAQSRFQVKVFDSVTIAGGGFDPDTSTALYDSGEVASSADEHTTGTLPEGTNHGCYVRVAQTINGSLHWSDWDSNTFTVDYAAPVVATLGGTNNNATGTIAVTVGRDTGGLAWDAVTVERTDDLGVSFVFVRGATSAAASGNTFNVTDYEAPHSTNVSYRARGEAGGVLGNWFLSADLEQWTSTDVWLKSPADSTANLAVTLMEVPTFETSETLSTTLLLRTTTTAAADNLEELLGGPRQSGVFHVLGGTHPVVVQDNGTALLFQTPPSWGVGERWLAVLSYSKSALGAPNKAGNVYRQWSVEVVEVDRPPEAS